MIPGPFTPEQASDLAEIQQKIYWYGWCIDQRRFGDLDGIFLPDAIVHYDLPGGAKKPWKEMKEWLPKGLQFFRVTQHNMSNPMISLDGDRASSKTYGHLIHVQDHKDGETSVMRHHTIYTDAWQRTDAGWRIASRTLSNLFMDGPVFGPDKVHLFAEPKPY